LSDAIAKKGGSKKAEVKKDVLDLIGKISPTETLSVVVIPPAAAAQGGGPAADVTQVTGGITVAEGVKTHLQMATKNADAAKTLADQINQGLQQAAALLPDPSRSSARTSQARRSAISGDPPNGGRNSCFQRSSRSVNTALNFSSDASAWSRSDSTTAWPSCPSAW